MSSSLKSPLVADLEGGAATQRSSSRRNAKIIGLVLASALGLAAVACIAYSTGSTSAGDSTVSSKLAAETVTASSLVDDVEGPEAVYSTMFKDWMVKHDKAYASMEHAQRRFKTFMQNVETLKTMNEQDSSAEYELNQFADMSPEEFQKEVLSDMVSMGKDDHAAAPKAPADRYMALSEIPDSLDWREKGAVSDVRDQQQCGSCWAFSAAQELESKWFLKHNEMNTLSVSQILECDPHDPACYGGWPMHAYQYIQEAGGLAAEEDYPYVVNNHVICLANQTWNTTEVLFDDPPLTNWCDLKCKKVQKVAATIASFEAVDQDEDKIAAYLAANGPISVGMNAGFLQFYRKGVAAPWKMFCNPARINHAVLLVGYGEEKGKKYWLVKNSWGTKWGEDGYFRLIRGDGRCGINTLASAVVAGEKA